jgi:CRISPR-associated endonuclease/helicase Cas3
MRLCIRFKQLFLLVSATPNYYFVKDFLDISEDGIEGIQSFNDKKYQIKFVDYVS